MLLYSSFGCLIVLNLFAFYAMKQEMNKNPDKKIQAALTLFLYLLPLIYVADQCLKQLF